MLRMWVALVWILALLAVPAASGAKGISLSYYPASITSGPDGALWFTQQLLDDELIEPGRPAGKIGRISTAGQFSEFPLHDWSPSEITAGPDGNLWFTEDGEESGIGRITPTGQVTHFLLGQGGVLGGIAAGPDGALWFTLKGAPERKPPLPAEIGRITPVGEIARFSYGLSPKVVLGDIIAGPDGNLWFTERAGNRIGRITPAGQITEFSSGLWPTGSPDQLTVGPDGNIWATGSSSDVDDSQWTGLISILPSGAIQSFEQEAFVPVDITSGSDGALWMAASGDELAPQITRMSLDGSLRSYQLTDDGWPERITAGSDGNLWFTGVHAGGRATYIGRMTVDGTFTRFGADPGRPQLKRYRLDTSRLRMTFRCPENSAGCRDRDLFVETRRKGQNHRQVFGLPWLEAGEQHQRTLRLSASVRAEMRAGASAWLHGLPGRPLRLKRRQR